MKRTNKNFMLCLLITLTASMQSSDTPARPIRIKPIPNQEANKFNCFGYFCICGSNDAVISPSETSRQAPFNPSINIAETSMDNDEIAFHKIIIDNNSSESQDNESIAMNFRNSQDSYDLQREETKEEEEEEEDRFRYNHSSAFHNPKLLKQVKTSCNNTHTDTRRLQCTEEGKSFNDANLKKLKPIQSKSTYKIRRQYQHSQDQLIAQHSAEMKNMDLKLYSMRKKLHKAHFENLKTHDKKLVLTELSENSDLTEVTTLTEVKFVNRISFNPTTQSVAQENAQILEIQYLASQKKLKQELAQKEKAMELQLSAMRNSLNISKFIANNPEDFSPKLKKCFQFF